MKAVDGILIWVSPDKPPRVLETSGPVLDRLFAESRMFGTAEADWAEAKWAEIREQVFAQLFELEPSLRLGIRVWEGEIHFATEAIEDIETYGEWKVPTAEGIDRLVRGGLMWPKRV